MDLCKRTKGKPLIPTDPHGTDPAGDTMALQVEAEKLRLHLIVGDVHDPFIEEPSCKLGDSSI